MVTRAELLSKVKLSKKNIGAKKLQIKGSKKKIDFKGVRIQDQFFVGRSGIKSFRAQGKAERKQGFVDLGIFSKEMVGLQSDLDIAKKDLLGFDLGGAL